MKKLIQAAVVACAALSMAGCASDLATVNTGTAIAVAPVNTGIAATAIISAATTYDGLKAGVTAFARYCVAQNNTPAICSASTRRTIVSAVRTGDVARASAEAAIANGSTVAAAVYMTLTNSIAALQSTPVPQFAANP